jgi:hypothetical protein
MLHIWGQYNGANTHTATLKQARKLETLKTFNFVLVLSTLAKVGHLCDTFGMGSVPHHRCVHNTGQSVLVCYAKETGQLAAALGSCCSQRWFSKLSVGQASAGSRGK